MFLTILICTRNGSRTIAEALQYIVQEISTQDASFEIIVADNGSTDATSSIVREVSRSTDLQIRLLTVHKPGKIHAFEAGIRQAQGEIICIIDDDNFVHEDFFLYARDFFYDYPNVAVIGSANQLAEGIEAPSWFTWAKGRYACSRPFIKGGGCDNKGRETGSIGVVAGAGMCFRKSPLVNALNSGYRFFNDTQRGCGMRITGEDIELCWLLRSMGFQFGFDPRMRLSHAIAKNRLEIGAFDLLCYTIGAGSLGYDPFMFTVKNDKSIKSIKWSWRWQLISKLKKLATRYVSPEFSDLCRDERFFRNRVARIECRGAIARILYERERYSRHIMRVANGEWTKWRVQ